MQKYNFFSNKCYVEKYFFHKAYLTLSISNRQTAMQVKILFILRCKNSYVSNNANELSLLYRRDDVHIVPTTGTTTDPTTRTTTDPTTRTENVPRDLLTTTTLTLPERFFFLRTNMGAKVDIFGLRHPAPPNYFYNCLIFIPRYLMAQNVMKSGRLE